MRSFLLLLLLAMTPAALSAQDKPTDYQLDMHVKIPLRDGIHLNATLFKPVAAAGAKTVPLPVVFMLSPYPADNSHPSAAYFAQHGYIYAYVDVRGRGDSEGVFHALDEAQDGYDVAEWLGTQPWSNGKVAMFGGSYAGMDQWQAASLHPPHLVAIAPVASVRPGVDFPFQGNIPSSYDLQWLTFTSGHSLYLNAFEDYKAWSSAEKRLYLAKAPFNQLETFAGSTGTDFQLWLSHPEMDGFWKKIGLSRDQVAGITLPMLAITGTHDGDQPGTLSYYEDHITSANRMPPANYFLVIGPWNHPGTREPKAEFGGEKYGPASLIDLLRLHREWYDYAMLGKEKPAFLQKNVAYYVSGEGAECWKYADSLAAVSAKSMKFYLDATGGAASLYHSGSLTESAKGAAGGSFVSDPNDLSGAEDSDAQFGLDLGGQGLVFHTAPFTEEMELDGRADLRLSLAMDVPDTDLIYDLKVVTPDGRAHSIDQAILRARYRKSLEHGEAVVPNKPEVYTFSATNWFAMRAPKGSVLRLVIAAANDPGMEKNWNSMKPVAEQSGVDARVGHIQLVQSREHPSTLTMPLGDPKAACKASASW